MRSGHWLALACWLAAGVGLGLAGCGNAPTPPSILLFVSDTTRADAVSAYGAVEGTTPALDALAREGQLYRNAYANAPWTLPSHATLFSGLLPHQHGIGWEGLVAADSLQMLAERLWNAGYETMALSENGWVSDTLNMVQGFERYERMNPPSAIPEKAAQEPDPTVTRLAEWLRERKPGRPVFVFINIVDAHWPYTVRSENRFLPEGVSDAEAGEVPQWPPEYFCPERDVEHEMAVQRGLYLGDVAEADRRFASIRQVMLDAGLETGLISIFTSDHGEHFGEHRRSGHQFSLHEALLRIPLVVHGVPGAAPAEVGEAVQLADVYPSVLRWAGLGADRVNAGRPLPQTEGGSQKPRPIFAAFRDPEHAYAGEPEIAARFRAQTHVMRNQCDAEERVWGNMDSMLVTPHKIIGYERFPSELYDLAKDPAGRLDIATEQPQRVREMEEALGRMTGPDAKRMGPPE